MVGLPHGYFNANMEYYDHWYQLRGIYIVDNNYPCVKEEGPYRDYFVPVVEEHKELLTEGNRVFIHPCCNLSRTLVSTKYNKSLDAWTADVVAIPEAQEYDVLKEDIAVFVNEDEKIVVLAPYSEEDKCDFESGLPYSSVCNSNALYKWCLSHECTDKFANILQSTLIWHGSATKIDPSASWIADLMTGMLPSNKLVYEKTLMESLGSEDNKVTLDSLVSLISMLKSPDDATVAVGLKSIASMDYVHYTASIVFALQLGVYNYRYNKAMNSTVVKYMFRNFLNMRNIRKNPVMPKEIYPEDYELFKKLVTYYNAATEDTVMDFIKYYPFMHANAEGQCVPRLKS